MLRQADERWLVLEDWQEALGVVTQTLSFQGLSDLSYSDLA